MSEIVVLHDSFDTIGGAEHVAVTMAKIFNAPIYTTTKTTNFYDDKAEIIPLIKEKSDNYAISEARIASVFKKLKLEHDFILSSGDKVKFYESQNGQRHINYTYTPQRMFYDLRHVYRQNFSFPKSIFFDLFGFYWRKRIKKTLKNIDRLVCISEVVKERIRKYWDIDTEVIYPPIETFRYKYKSDENYFLYISRLNSIKRIDIVVDTFKKIDEKLVVIGKDEKDFDKIMKKIPNIDYRGQVSEDEKIDLLAHCKAVIYPPKEEDFGIVPIEAFASGKPVIGVKEGFTRYQIESYINGLFMEEVTPLGLEKAIKEFERCDWNKLKIQSYAKEYDINRFMKKIRDVVYEKNRRIL